MRWLRPDVQQGTTMGAQAEIEVEAGEDEQPASIPVVVPVEWRPWPSGLPEQIKAVADVLTRTTLPLEHDAIAEHFRTRGG